MTMTSRPEIPEDGALDALFAAARAAPVAPSDALLARVLADAADVQPAAAPPGVARRGQPGRTRWHLWDLLGGWPVAGSAAAAGIAGLWLGLSPPAAVENLAADLLGSSTAVSLWPDLSAIAQLEVTDG